MFKMRLRKLQFYFVLIAFLLILKFSLAYDPTLYFLGEHDYSQLRLWQIDKDGYIFYQNENGSFKWKLDAYLPEDMPLVGLGPFTPKIEVVMHLKEISDGMEILVPMRTEFAGMEKSEKVMHNEEEYYKVTGVKELEITTYMLGHSFLGNYMFDPSKKSISLFGERFNTITIHIPKNRQLLDYERHIKTLLLDDYTIFGQAYSTLPVIYTNPERKMWIQLGLAAITLVFVVLAIRWQKIFASLNFSSRHLFFAYLICFMLMMQLAFIFPNPFPINVETGIGAEVYTSKQHIPYYMNYILGLTDSFDSLYINNFDWCEPDIFSKNRKISLPIMSSSSIFIPASLADTKGCIGMITKNFGKDKLKFIGDTEKQLEEELSKLNNRHYLLDFAFGFIRRFIFLMFMVAGFLAIGFILLASLEVRKFDQLVYAGAGIILIVFMTQILNILIGFVAHMPVTYHGGVPIDLTMSSRFLPGINQAHNVRLAVLGAGGLFVFLFNRKIRNAISPAFFFVPVLILVLFMTLPQTEFAAKKSLVGIVCGDCGINYVRGKLLPFDIRSIYASVRESAPITGNLFDLDQLTDYDLGERLIIQGEKDTAMRLFENYIYDFPNSEEAGTAAIKVAQYKLERENESRAIELYRFVLENAKNDEYRTTAVTFLGQIFSRQNRKNDLVALYSAESFNMEKEENRVNMWMKLAKVYESIDITKALREYNKIAATFEGKPYAETAIENIARIKFEQALALEKTEFEAAKEEYLNIVSNYKGTGAAAKAAEKLAGFLFENGKKLEEENKFGEAKEIYKLIISAYPNTSHAKTSAERIVQLETEVEKNVE